MFRKHFGSTNYVSICLLVSPHVSNMKNIVFSIYKYCFETYASINDILRCVGANDSPHYKHDKTLTVFPSLFRA